MLRLGLDVLRLSHILWRESKPHYDITTVRFLSPAFEAPTWAER